MRPFQRVFVFFILALCFVVFFAPAANAQAMTSYVFLEVTNSNKEPVSDAVVETRIRDYRPTTQTPDEKTDKKGIFKAEFLDAGRAKLSSQFTIFKPGYFPFYDFGNLQTAGDRRVKVELLKIPIDKKERKALGNEQLKRDFFVALQKQDVETVRKLLKYGISPDIKIEDLRVMSGYDNLPAILYPVVQRNIPILKMLLEAGADIRRKDEYLSNILFYYFQTGLYTQSGKTEAEKEKLLSEFNEGLRELIKAGADVNADGRGTTPLILAVLNGYAESVKILLAAGADVNAKDASFGTALTLAKKYQGYGYDKIAYQEIIKILEAAGAK